MSKGFAKRMHGLVAELKQQSAEEKAILAKLLGATAQLAVNADRVIDEAADAARDALESK